MSHFPFLNHISRFALLSTLAFATTPQTTAKSAQAEGALTPQATIKKVAALVFDPIVSTAKGKPRLHQYKGWNDPHQLLADYQEWISSTTTNAYQYKIVSSQEIDSFPVTEDGSQYDMQTYLDCLDQVPGACHRANLADYGAILAEHDICEALNHGELDEVWLFGGPHFGFEESTFTGPQANRYSPSPVVGTSCQKLLPIMGYNYENDLDQMVFSQLSALTGIDAEGNYDASSMYMLTTDIVAETKNLELTCSSEYASGWCQHVLDSYHGFCNWREWATEQEPTGWVRVTFAGPTAVSGIKLWDRACAEQVLSGHIEFSDGSPQVAFGPLEDTGHVATELSFSGTRLVTWLEVHLDLTGGVGPNPGLGEIELIYGQTCTNDLQCGEGSYCNNGPACAGAGLCQPCGPELSCLDIWAPVLGCDGNIYSNQCYAAQACVPVAANDV